MNASKIASVCLTDAATVEAMLSEFIAQLSARAKQGAAKINLKIGSLLIKAGGATQFL